MGSKLPPGVSQPPHFAKPPWETQHQACVTLESTVGTQRLDPPTVGRPLNHIPHIRNPKLRQYYLQGKVVCTGECCVYRGHRSYLSGSCCSVTGCDRRFFIFFFLIIRNFMGSEHDHSEARTYSCSVRWQHEQQGESHALVLDFIHFTWLHVCLRRNGNSGKLERWGVTGTGFTSTLICVVVLVKSEQIRVQWEFQQWFMWHFIRFLLRI